MIVYLEAGLLDVLLVNIFFMATRDIMDSINRRKNLSGRVGAAWITAEYASLKCRADLISRYNAVAGPPSEFITQVHNDFLKDRMEPDEVVAFVIVCEELITAAHQWNQEKAEGCTSENRSSIEPPLQD
jgi:hypothetical protein